jgi:2-polyprenyl-6-methoxyphenol hydroxylase-like FAD-dependent oxidoreductase
MPDSISDLKTQVLIVGAGPTGLTAGVELARRGIKSVIIEKRSSASKLSKAIGINPKSLALLSESGITKKLLASGVKYTSMNFYKGSKHWINLDLTQAPVKFGYNIMLSLPQFETEAILADTYKNLGGEINYASELIKINQSNSKVTITTKSGKEIQSDYLISADGANSTSRHLLGIEYSSTKLKDVWSIADVEINGWPHLDSASICLLNQGQMSAILPLGGSRFRVLSNTEDALKTFPLKVQVIKINRQAQFTIRFNQVQSFSKGRVYLAGDAAHSHSPVGGRGMNLGIADAADLAARIAGEKNLTDYSIDRLNENLPIIASTESLRKFITSKSKLKRISLLFGLKLISLIPFLRRKLASQFLYAE